MEELDCCMICPRECGANRNAGSKGYCGKDAGYHIASVCIHKGEEPALTGTKGICNLFFSGCNLRCIYCQNFQINRPHFTADSTYPTLESITEKIISCLDDGIDAIGFVSPSHFTPHVKAIIRSLHRQGYHPVVVYNTNAYDHVEIIKSLEGLIDVYLPDFKYFHPHWAMAYSDAADYPEIAKSVISEMYRQKGSTVVMDDKGQAVTGLIIRHLVLPGQSIDSMKFLDWIASELSSSVYISLMSQYYPAGDAVNHSVLGRKITKEEYHVVIEHMENLGFHKGWIQDYGSSSSYRPDFNKTHPFEY